MKQPLRFSGVMPANVLPFTSDLAIDEPAYRRHLRWLADTRGVTWRGEAMVDSAGAPLPFSPEAADQLLSDLPELRDEIIGASIQLDTFRKEDDETTKGN